jgi:hypothetical protein
MWRRFFGAVVGSFLLTANAAAATPIILPGATLTPGAETQPACKLAVRYLELISQGDAQGVGVLFADDAVFYGIQRAPIRGRPEITAFYARMLSRVSPTTSQIAGLVPAGKSDCFLEYGGVSGRVRTVDRLPNATSVSRFTLDKTGKLARLYFYFRPDTVDTLRAAGLAPDY